MGSRLENSDRVVEYVRASRAATNAGVPEPCGSGSAPILKDQIARLVADTKGTMPPAESPNGSAADKLLKLAQLRDSGAITPEEFETHKAKLMDKL